ncbi:MAG: hypothetical protein M3R44_02695 [Candidatus Eremiobacteraeota bacterium]|nr:hypothetical protein [Candidatus Eremiobacteraeota bacterium]
MTRSSLALVLLATIVGGYPVSAQAGRPTARAASAYLLADAKKDQPQTKNAGTVDGHVAAISYSGSTMTVVAGPRRVEVHILPSTNIQGPGNGFHSIADIKKGAHVRVLLSQTGTTYNAQLITLE